MSDDAIGPNADDGANSRLAWPSHPSRESQRRGCRTRSVDFLGNQKLETVLPGEVRPLDLCVQQRPRRPAGRSNGPRALQPARDARLLRRRRDPRSCSWLRRAPARLAFCKSTDRRFATPPEVTPFRTIEPHVVSLPWGGLPTLSMSATSDMRTEQLIYWTRVGEHLPSNWREQRMVVAMDNLRRVIPDAIMVRVSTYGSDKARRAHVDRRIHRRDAQFGDAGDTARAYRLIASASARI